MPCRKVFDVVRPRDAFLSTDGADGKSRSLAGPRDGLLDVPRLAALLLPTVLGVVGARKSAPGQVSSVLRVQAATWIGPEFRREKDVPCPSGIDNLNLECRNITRGVLIGVECTLVA